jgi:Kef-type K+ transport system membrane component KefB
VNELTSIGVILLLALAAGHIVKLLGVPEVTGYIVAGSYSGPRCLAGLCNNSTLTLSRVLSEIALGLILFSVGAVFDMARFYRIGRKALLITVAESAAAAAAVTGGALMLGQHGKWRRCSV